MVAGTASLRLLATGLHVIEPPSAASNLNLGVRILEIDAAKFTGVRGKQAVQAWLPVAKKMTHSQRRVP
jgi:hypothetical protein